MQHLLPVLEFNTGAYKCDQVRRINFAPPLLCGEYQLEGHRETGLARAGALRLPSPDFHCRERRLDRVGGAQMQPMLRRKVKKGQHCFLILHEALRCFGIARFVLFHEVLNFLFPGDLIGLDAIMMGMASHTTEALTPVKLSVFDRKQVWELFSKMPQRAMMLTWQVAREEHFLSEALVTVGQRSAREALAWAFVTLYERGSQTGLVRDGKMPFPVRQQDLADALGLSLVHTNKTLARLRSEGLVRWAQGILELPDLQKLADIGVVELGAGPPRYYL